MQPVLAMHMHGTCEELLVLHVDGCQKTIVKFPFLDNIFWQPGKESGIGSTGRVNVD